jgi:hypothetical protein
VVLLILLIRGATLEGASKGISYYIGAQSNFTKLREAEVRFNFDLKLTKEVNLNIKYKAFWFHLSVIVQKLTKEYALKFIRVSNHYNI